MHALWNLHRLFHHHHDLKTRRNLRVVGDGTEKRLVPEGEYLPPERAPP